MELSVRYVDKNYVLTPTSENKYQTDNIILTSDGFNTFELFENDESTGVFLTIDTSIEISNIEYSEKYKEDNWNFIRVTKNGPKNISISLEKGSPINRFAKIGERFLVYPPRDISHLYSIFKVNGEIVGDSNPYIPIEAIHIHVEDTDMDKIIYGPFDQVEVNNILVG